MLIEVVTAVAASWARIAIAIILSIIAALLIGIPAGLNRRVESVVLPVLDVLQSVPILGFFPLALLLFVSLIPVIGAELAVIFLIFTSTFWNIAFAVYESTRNVPTSILEVRKMSRLPFLTSMRMIFIPVAIPRIVYNLPASIANAFYFLTASEMIFLGTRRVSVFGIGTLVARYVESGNIFGLASSIGILALSIALVFSFIVNPASKWSERFRLDFYTMPPARAPLSIAPPRSPLRRALTAFRERILTPSLHIHIPVSLIYVTQTVVQIKRVLLVLLIIGLITISASSFTEYLRGVPDVAALFVKTLLELNPLNLLSATFFSMLRILLALLISLGWAIPVSYLLSRRENLRSFTIPAIQVIASIPAPIFFPLIANALYSVTELREIASVILILMGTQWYVFYCTLGGFLRVPREYIEIASLHNLGNRRVLRSIFLPIALPSIVTGLITATGGGWNTLVIAERVIVGNKVFETDLPGLGKLLSISAEEGSLYEMAVIISLMTTIIVLINRVVWRRIYDWAVWLTREQI